MNIRPGKKIPALGLSATLAIAFFSLSLVVLLISSGLQVYSNVASQREAMASKQQLIAQETAGTVSAYIQDKLNLLDATSRLTRPADVSQETQEQIINSLLGIQQAFRQIIILNAQGKQIVSTSRLSQSASGILADKLPANTIDQIRQGKNYISPVYIDVNTSEPLSVFAVPIKNVFGDFEGVLAAEVNLKFMWELMDQIKVGQNGYAYVVDDRGMLIAFKDTARVLGENDLSKKQILKVDEFLANLTSPNVSKVETFTGIYQTRVVGTYVPLGTPTWAVITEVPWDEAFQPINQIMLWTSLITLASGIVALLIGYFLARRLSVPLVNLMTTANRIANGERELQAEVAGPREVASLAVAFNEMTGQLQQTLGNLEQRVADRTRALETSALVSRRISTILDANQLVLEVVEQLKLAFNYYHVHIYLFDPQRENLVMAGGSGEPGKLMLARGHKITKGRGLVGHAAETGLPVLVGDVYQAPNWLPNPLLPETKSEVAVPVAVGGNVLGVLDVQQNEVGALTQEDVDLLQSIANQIAVALQNTRIYAQVQHQASREALIATIGQRIQHTATVEEALRIAVREVGRAVGMQRTTIRLVTKPENGDKSGSPTR